MKKIVNIINFVRGIEPRPGRNIDLYATFRDEARLMRSLNLKGTFLLQYDALILPEYTSFLKDNLDLFEAGLWLEVVEPQVEAAGGVWQGRFPWDWYNDVGFLIGYEPEFRKKLIDAAMEKFKNIFGYYPSSVGAWHIDSVSMRYLSEKYGIDAACICRDQVGTDGYTMQGGYYNHAYYPSIYNMFCPAQSHETQINMPVFRMLGSDPILAYDFQVFGYDDEKCPTLEPAQRGRNSRWCDWYFDEIFSNRGLCFAYTQTGQENSFGWERIKGGVNYQFPLVKRLSDEGSVEIMTLGEAGKWYKSTFSNTPAAVYGAMSAWDGADRRSVWYSSSFYRANVMWERGSVRIRDLYIFNDKYKEHYYNERCDSHACEFRNLPVMDGTIYSSAQACAGIYFEEKNTPILFDAMNYEEVCSTAVITLTSGTHYVKLTFCEDSIHIDSDIPDLKLVARLDVQRFWGNTNTADAQFANHNNAKANITYVSKVNLGENSLSFVFDGFDYAVYAAKGHFISKTALACDGGQAELYFAEGDTV